MASFAVSLSNFAHALLLPLYMKEAGASEGAIGLVIGALSLTLVLGRFASGWAIDRWGAREFLIAGALVWALSAPLIALTQRTELLFLIRLIQGLALAFFTNAAIGYVSHAFGQQSRGRILSWWWISWSLAVPLGPLLAGFSLNTLGFSAAFIATGIVALAAAIPSLLVHSDRADHAHHADGTFSVLPRSAVVPGFVGISVGFASGALFTFLPLHGLEIAMENPGLFMSVMGVGMLPGQLFFGRLSDHRARSTAILPAMVIAMIAAWLIGQSDSIALSLVFAFFAGFSTSGISPVLTAWTLDRSAPRERASAAGASVAFREMGAFGGSAAMGALLGAASPQSAFLLIVGLLAIGLAIAGIAFRSDRATT